MLADWMGRKPLMILSGAAFILSIPVIALSQGYSSLFFGRLLQGMSGGLIGIVVPLYLAECLSASTRGKGTGVFQWMLTFGIVVAALIGIYFSYRVEAVAHLGDAAALFNFKNHAWRSIFWMSMPPGILFVLGAFMVTESPRWLYRRNQIEKARAALLRSRSPEQATIELQEMEAASKPAIAPAGEKVSDSLLRRKYIIPFLLACVILACNTATGINSVIGFNTNILIQSGLSDLQAHWGYVLLTAFNFCFTAVGMTLVDRKGRKFLFILGTSGIMLSMVIVGTLFHRTEKQNIDCRDQIQALVGPSQEVTSPVRQGGGAAAPRVSVRSRRRHRSTSAPPSPSSSPMATSPGPPATPVPTIPPRHRCPSRAPPPCPPTECRPSFRIPSATTTPPPPHP